MKAIRVHELDEPEVMRLEEVSDPKCGPGQVLVRIQAVGVNPVDTYIRAGLYSVKPTPCCHWCRSGEWHAAAGHRPRNAADGCTPCSPKDYGSNGIRKDRTTSLTLYPPLTPYAFRPMPSAASFFSLALRYPHIWAKT